MSDLTANLRGSIGADQRVTQSNPDNNPWSIGICRVFHINYEEMLVTLRTLTGTSEQFNRVPVPLASPGAGMRHFLGAMPEVGDLCVCGWMAQSTMNNLKKVPTRVPVILNWLPRGPWLGHDWLIEAPFAPEEHDFATERQKLLTQGVFQRTRHKMRHMQPGNILASSGQGSDLVLDESVTLSNRRGNELRLRDQDQALVTRSLQQFHAMAGTRIYGGMVQRDATLLTHTLVSDGLLWDGAQQLDDEGKPYWGGRLASGTGNDIFNLGLPTNNNFPNNYLQPSRILARPLVDNVQQTQAFALEGRLDPYNFLNNGLFVDENGYTLSSTGVNFNSGTGYGGKRIFRTALLSDTNATLTDATTDPNLPTFTEYRIEVAHTSDGLLPVTEQTDGFDADRLPEQAPVAGTEQPQTNNSPNSPFITFALGTVVGNDPYTQAGRKVYGVPLTPVVLGSDPSAPTPQMASALWPAVPLSEQAATLFMLSPILPKAGPNTFWSVKKNGAFLASISGPPEGNSVEFATTGNVAGTIGGSLDLLVQKTINLKSAGGSQTDNTALNLHFPTGTVNLYAGGRAEGPAANAADASDQDGGSASVPTMTVGGKHVSVQGDEQATLQSANTTTVNSPNTTVISGGNSVVINGGKKLTQTAEQHEVNVLGKQIVTMSGPAGLSPASGPVRETTIQAATAGVVDKYSVPVTGSREETFTAGNHTTMIQVGNLTYQTTQGTFTAKAGGSFVEVASAYGIAAYAANGYAALTAAAGPATVTGQTAASLTATAGPATVKGLAVILSATGGKVGGILSGADIEPFTGLPFALLGCGSLTQRLSL